MVRPTQEQARRPRTRPGRYNLHYNQFLKQSQMPKNAFIKIHADDWAMEWLYEDFILWAEIKIDPKSQDRMMRENTVIAHFNRISNQKTIHINTDIAPLAYLSHLISQHKKTGNSSQR